MGSTDETIIDQISAEAAEKLAKYVVDLQNANPTIIFGIGLKHNLKPIIQPIIEKAFDEGWNNRDLVANYIESRAAHASEQRPTPATASERDSRTYKIGQLVDFGAGYHRKVVEVDSDGYTFDTYIHGHKSGGGYSPHKRKPDSASTGKDEALQIIDEQIPHFQFALTRKNGRHVWLHDLIRELAATPFGGEPDGFCPKCKTEVNKSEGYKCEWCDKPAPSGGGEWTRQDVEKWLCMHTTTPGLITKVQDAINAALRDCGNDKKRLDNALMALRALADCDHRTGATQIRIIVREALLRDAAMLETGEQKVDWLRAAAGPTEEQQTGEQTKEKE